MQWKNLASVLAKQEGKKSQVKVGNIREIMARLVDIQKQCQKDGEVGPAELIASRAGVTAKGKKK